MSKIIPLNDRVLLKVIDAEEITESGLFIPETAREQQQLAKVIEVSVEVKAVKPGDTVIFAKFAGNQVKFQKEEYLTIKTMDLLAVVRE
jgi:chaperonin GroES